MKGGKTLRARPLLRLRCLLLAAKMIRLMRLTNVTPFLRGLKASSFYRLPATEAHSAQWLLGPAIKSRRDGGGAAGLLRSMPLTVLSIAPKIATKVEKYWGCASMATFVV